MQIVIHKDETNVITTTHRLDNNLTMMEIGYYCVPEGLKFKIIDADEYHSIIDNDFYEAFDYDFENDYDGVGMGADEWETYKIQNK